MSTGIGGLQGICVRVCGCSGIWHLVLGRRLGGRTVRQGLKTGRSCLSGRVGTRSGVAVFFISCSDQEAITFVLELYPGTSLGGLPGSASPSSPSCIITFPQIYFLPIYLFILLFLFSPISGSLSTETHFYVSVFVLVLCLLFPFPTHLLLPQFLG